MVTQGRERYAYIPCSVRREVDWFFGLLSWKPSGFVMHEIFVCNQLFTSVFTQGSKNAQFIPMYVIAVMFLARLYFVNCMSLDDDHLLIDQSLLWRVARFP